MVHYYRDYKWYIIIGTTSGMLSVKVKSLAAFTTAKILPAKKGRLFLLDGAGVSGG